MLKAARLNLRLISLATSWLGLVGLGFYVLVHYSLTPGKQGDSPTLWPVSSSLTRDPTLPTLIVVLHPRCPCSRATLSELAGIITHCQGRISARVLFVRPPGLEDPWTQTDLWRTAQTIPDVVAIVDKNGIEAERFGALTSGQVALYDHNGRLAFHGGITGARGHAGPNPGEHAIERLVNDGGVHFRTTEVYGCQLKGAAETLGEPAKRRPSCPSS